MTVVYVDVGARPVKEEPARWRDATTPRGPGGCGTWKDVIRKAVRGF